MQKSKGNYVNYLGILFGILSLIIIILSLVFLVKDRRVFRDEMFAFKRWERVRGEKFLKEFSGRSSSKQQKITLPLKVSQRPA